MKSAASIHRNADDTADALFYLGLMGVVTHDAKGKKELGIRLFAPFMVLAASILYVVTGWGLLGTSSSAAVQNRPTSKVGTSLRAVSHPSGVAVFGDSLSFETQPYFMALIHADANTPVTYDALGGTAICDWLPIMRQVERSAHPKAVELEFSGNALTPCMKGLERPEPAYFAKYRVDTEAAINIFVRGGAHVYLIGAPITRFQSLSRANWDALNVQYAHIAAADRQHVTFVDAGSAVEGPSHSYARTLPCLPIEPCMGPAVNGIPSNTVRAPDGVHFCPVSSGNKKGVIRRCAVYSSGAFRYGLAMVEALASPAYR